MPKPTKGPRLGGTPTHQRIILNNLASQLFEHGKITTTETKAKRMQPLAETLITKAKRGDLHARRLVLSRIGNKSVVHTLFTEIAPKFADREGGYTRITKIGPRKGDNAPMAVIELVREPLSAKRATVKEAEAATKRAAKDRAAKDEAAKPQEASPQDGEPQDALVLDDAATDVPATGAASLTGEIDDAPVTDADGGYGPDSAAPLADDSAPEGFTIKGNADSMMYHEPDGRWYDQTVAEVWFRTAAAAEAAGFTKAGAPSTDDA